MHRAECPSCGTSYKLNPNEQGERLIIQCAVCKSWMDVRKRFGGYRFPLVTPRNKPE